MDKISDLLAATEDERTSLGVDDSAPIRVVYQTPVAVSWNGVDGEFTGRTLEEAFALSNLQLTQDVDHKGLQLGIRGGAAMALDELASAIHRKVANGGVDKTDFVLGLMLVDGDWVPPKYIVDGLQWLRGFVVPQVLAAAVLDEQPDEEALDGEDSQ